MMRRHPFSTYKGRSGLVAALVLMVPAIALYLLTAPWPDTPDGLFHLHRVRALAEALRLGVLYPRWFPDFAFGYGYPVLNFYAPLFYYPPALLHLAGLDVITAVRLTLAAFYALSGWAAYWLLRCWTRPVPALLGAILYLAFPYRLYDLFVRGALPEFAAFLWPPLIAWATMKWVTDVLPGADTNVTRDAAEDQGSRTRAFPGPLGAARAGRRFLRLRGQPANPKEGLRAASSPGRSAAIFRADTHVARGATADEKCSATPQELRYRAAIFRADAHVAAGATADKNRAEHPERRAVARSRRGGVVAGRPHPSTALRSAQDARDSTFRAGPLLLASLSWAGLILTHNLTALMTALTGMGVLASWVVGILLRRPRGDRIPSLLVPILGLGVPLALGALLSGPYALPALLEARWVGIGMAPETLGYTTHFASLGNLFDFSLVYRYPAAAQPTVPVPGYVVPLILIAGSMMFSPAARGYRTRLGTSIGSALGTSWLSTRSSAFLWDGLAPLLGKLQFPWRWQAITALAMAAVLALTLEIGCQWMTTRSRPARKTRTPGLAPERSPTGRLHARLRHPFSSAVASQTAWTSALIRPLAWGLGLALAVGLVSSAFGGLHTAPAQFSAANLTSEQMWDFDARHGQVGATWAGEFLPRWVTEQRWAIGRDPSTGAGILQSPQTVQTLRVLGQGYLGERLRYTASAPGQLVYHAFYYPAWRVEVDGQRQPTYPVGELGLLAVDIPAGEHEVVRRWGATPAMWAGRAAAALGWLTILGLFVAQGSRRWRNIGLWLAIAVLAAIGGSERLAREQTPSQIGANYGIVRLESALVTPARAGETAQVMLYWLVTGAPEPLTAFVHVLTPDGHMVAGHDAPLAGMYTPASRWRIGQLLPDCHPVPLPAGLSGGTYRVKAGVYRPGAADKPLTPVGANPADPRVELGVLEVRP